MAGGGEAVRGREQEVFDVVVAAAVEAMSFPVAVAEKWRNSSLSLNCFRERARLSLRFLRLRPSCTRPSHLRASFSPSSSSEEEQEEEQGAEERHGRVQEEREKRERKGGDITGWCNACSSFFASLLLLLSIRLVSRGRLESTPSPSGFERKVSKCVEQGSRARERESETIFFAAILRQRVALERRGSCIPSEEACGSESGAPLLPLSAAGWLRDDESGRARQAAERGEEGAGSECLLRT